MNTLSENAKKELLHALDGKQSGAFVVNGKLISIEVENSDSNTHDELALEELSQEIEEYPELKESLTRYLDKPGMKRYTGSDLKAKRYEKNHN